MAGKRKQILLPKEDLETDWQTLRSIGSQVKRGKFLAQAPACDDQELITTQLVEYNTRKGWYTPAPNIKEKQFVKLAGDYTFENLYGSIWRHYGSQMKCQIDESTHALTILLTKSGPRATKTAELRGKKNFMVCFEEINVNSQKVHNTGAQESTTKSKLPSATVTSIVLERSTTNQPSPPAAEKSHYSTSHQLLDAQLKTSSTTDFYVKKSVIPKLKLSLDDLIALGRKLPEVKWIPGKIRSLIFDSASQGFAWSDWTQIKINRGTRIGQGGFREAFRCTVDGASDLTNDVYVLKTFLPDTVDHRRSNISILNDDCTEVEASMELNMKAVQTLSLARILSEQFREKFEDREISLPRYVKSWLVEFSSGDYGTVEEFISGKFEKYLNNSMDQNQFPTSSESGLKAIAFAHFTYEYGSGTFMVTDLQGVDMTLTDPEVATKRSFTVTSGKGEMVFGAGNLPEALDNFSETHVCNSFCKMAKLKPLSKPM